jgi:plasmid stabilization system protein ParE
VKVVLTSAARDDLTRIGGYIAIDNLTRARSFVRELREKVLQIGDAPRAFPLVPYYEQSGIRRRTHGDYLIFYKIEDNRIIVLHIIHGSQDYGKVLFPEK